jgi:hypothetical protein
MNSHPIKQVVILLFMNIDNIQIALFILRYLFGVVRKYSQNTIPLNNLHLPPGIKNDSKMEKSLLSSRGNKRY